MKLTPRVPKCAPDVYLDSPAEVCMTPGGMIELSLPRNMLVTWERQQQISPTGPSVLSVRWTENGLRYFDVGKERYAVDDTGYMVFNNGTAFASEIDSETLVRCYTVNFVPGIAEETLRSLITPADRLLDTPEETATSEVHFFEKTYRHDAFVTPVLRRLARCRDSYREDYGWFEEQFRLLLEGLLYSHRNVFREMERIPAVRASTREELYSRLNLARDFMEASLHLPLTIPQIARQACLSPHHFLRLFKQMFEETPHQYLTRRRIERARQMLLLSDTSVTNICFALGFESLGSFSWLFRARTGLSPEQFRMQSRRGILLPATGFDTAPPKPPVNSGGSQPFGLALAPKTEKPTGEY